jgi:ComF family protein
VRLREAADVLLAIALAPACAACGRVLARPTAGPVCEACWTSIRAQPPPLCRTCGDPLPSWRTVSVEAERCPRCRRAPGAIDTGRAAGEYEDALRRIIHAFKYEGRRSLARPLARLMRAAAGDILRDADVAVPVPLHPWRRLRRGFNQSSDLARALGVPCVHALMRVRATPPQTGLTAAGRRRNVRGAFQVSPPFLRRARDAALHDRVVVLVDDVRTTGATLDACAVALKEAGAREVRALTAARAALHEARRGLTR